MSAEPLLGKVNAPPADADGNSFIGATYVTPYKPPVLTGQAFGLKIGTALPAGQRPAEDPWDALGGSVLGTRLSMRLVTSSIPELRNIRTYPRLYPDGVTYSDPYPSRVTSGKLWAVTETPPWDQYGVESLRIVDDGENLRTDWRDDEPLTYPEDSYYPGVPLAQNENEVLNPPCEGGGGGVRPDYGVLYPRKI